MLDEAGDDDDELTEHVRDTLRLRSRLDQVGGRTADHVEAALDPGLTTEGRLALLASLRETHRLLLEIRADVSRIDAELGMEDPAAAGSLDRIGAALDDLERCLEAESRSMTTDTRINEDG